MQPRRWAKRAGISRPVIWALVAALSGALLARRFDVPGGAFTGAMLLTAAVNVAGLRLAQPPRWMAVASRITLGITTGAAVTNETIQAVARALVPVSLMVVSLMAIGLLTAWALNRWAHMDLPTALCGAAPGALAAMVALADDLKGDSPTVASLHLVRLVSVIVFMPILVTSAFVPAGEPTAPLAVAGMAAQTRVLRLAFLLLVGLAVGFVAERYRVPAGDFLAGMVIAAALNPLLLHLGEMPASWKLFAQWMVGAGVGASVTRETLRHFRPYALAGALMTLFLIAIGLALGWVLSLVSGLDLLTCVMGAAPGGATTLVILAEELGADAQLVSAMHVSRIVIIMLLLPLLVRFASLRLAARARREAQTNAVSAQ